MAMNDQISPHVLQRAKPREPSVAAAPVGKLPLPVTIYFLMILLPIEFNLGSLFMTGVRATLIAMMIPMSLRLFSGKVGRILWTDVLFLLFSIWAILTLFRNNPDQAISFGGSVGVEFLGGYLLGRTYIRTKESFLSMCRMLFLVVAITIPFALYESQTGVALIPTLIAKLPVVYSIADFYNELAGRRLGLERAQVIFPHPILYGLFCSTTISLALIGFKGVVSNSFRMLIAFTMLVGVFLSVSSGALLPVVLQFGLITWAKMFDRVRARWLILVGIVVFFYVVIDILSNRTPVQVFLSYATFSPHNAYWRMLIFEWGMVNVWSNPVWGIGLNDWVRPWFMHTGSMDNFWLLVAVRYGIPGFVLVATGFFLVIWKVMWLDLEADRMLWQLRRAWIITMIGLTLSLCTVDVWATAYSYVAFLFGAGAWLIEAKPAPVAATTTVAAPELGRVGHRFRRKAPERVARSRPQYSRFPPKQDRPD